MPIRKGSGASFSHIHLGTQTFDRVYKGSQLVFQNSTPPTITAFSSTPSNIDLDTRATGNVSFAFAVNAQGGGSFARDSAKDFRLPSEIGSRLENGGAVSDGTTVWIVSSTRARAYNVSDRQRNTALDIDLSNVSYSGGSVGGGFLGGVYANNTLWFLNTATGAGRAFAYTASTRARLQSSDIFLGSRNFWRGGVSDGTTLWFFATDFDTDNIQAWTASTQARDTSKDFDDVTRNLTDGFSDGTTLWLLRSDLNTLRAYVASSQARDSGKDFNISTSQGAVSAGNTMWLLQNQWARAYTLPSPGLINTAQIYNERTGGKVGPEYRSGAGQALSQTVPNIPQPNQPTTYRVLVRNTGGSAHRDTQIDVTKNPTIANLIRTNFISRTGFSTFTFSMTVTGLPRPTLSYVFSGGSTGTIASSHFVQGANPYTWEIRNWSITFPDASSQRLTVTGTNSSGSVTATLANITA